MAFKGILLACLLFIGAALAQQTGLVSFQQVPSSVDVGTWTDRAFITLSEFPVTQLTLVVDTQTEGLVIEPTSFTFTPTVRSLSLRAYSEVDTELLSVSFRKQDDPSDQFVEPAGELTFTFENRTIDIDAFPDTFVGLPSEPMKIVLSTAPESDLTFVPQLDNYTAYISFNPNPIVVRAGSRLATFTWISSIQLSGADDLRWTVNGAENVVSRYQPATDLGSSVTPFEAQFRPIFIMDNIDDDFDMPEVLVGASGRNGIWVYTPQAVNSTFTVTPQAADTVFTPASAPIDNKMSAFFNFTTTTPGDRQIYLSVSGNNGIYAPVTLLGALSVPKRNVFVTLAGASLVIGNVTYMSVALSAPTANSLTVGFSAGNVRFNVSSVTFTGPTTAFTVAVHGVYPQEDEIVFTMSGPDADNHLFNMLPNLAVNVQELSTFILPSDYNQRSVYVVGVESEKIPIRVSVSPIARDGITITPVAANLVFNPTSLTFSNGTEQQYFTITPSANTERSSFDTTLTWLISGTDHTLYQLPAPATITVVYREIQKAWSHHLITDEGYTGSERHLGKTYKVWMSTNWIQKGEHVSVTPVSPFYRFKPAVLFFDGDHTRMEFEATVTGLGNGRIDYILGGKDGGYFLPIEADNFDLALRPLEIVAGVIFPSERTRASIYVADNRTSNRPCGTPCGVAPSYNTYNFDVSVLAQYHTHSFLIRSFVLPDEDLTITPHSPHVKFSPSKLTLKAGDAVKRIDLHTTVVADAIHPFNLTGVYLEANFTTEALAPGTHQVWFELTGKDSHYYSRIPVTPMTFNLVNRVESKDFKVSSSSFLFPSVAVVVMAAFALVL